MSVAPNVSTAGNLRTIALCLAIVCVPSAKIIVTIAGKPSGIAATAKETATKNMLIIKVELRSAESALSTPTIKTITQIAKIMMVRVFPS
ncbi:Uncharacterised protein [Chlamydia trachomatis]|nr:Uncharacterised protein [Chlamydia trachomatis]